MIHIRWFMTGMSDGDVDMGTLPFATEGEAAAFARGTTSVQDPPGTEYKFSTEIEAKWFDAGRSDARNCISNGYGIRTERLTVPDETMTEDPAGQDDHLR